MAESRTLEALLRESGVLGTTEVSSCVLALGAALDALHAEGLVHGEMRPADVLLDARGVARFASVARPHGAVPHDIAPEAVTHAAPERFEGSRPSPATDVYGLGLLAYEMLAGRRAFGREDDERRTRARILVGAPRLRDEVAGFPASVDEVVGRALARRAADRYASAGAFATALAGAIRASDPTQRLKRPVLTARPLSWRRARWQLAASLVTAFLVLLASSLVSASGTPRAVPITAAAAATAPSTTRPSLPASRSPALPTVAAGTTPDVVGMAAKDAAKVLRDSGLRNDVQIVVDVNAIGRAGTVARQGPAAGARFVRGQGATLYVVGPIGE